MYLIIHTLYSIKTNDQYKSVCVLLGLSIVRSLFCSYAQLASSVFVLHFCVYGSAIKQNDTQKKATVTPGMRHSTNLSAYRKTQIFSWSLSLERFRHQTDKHHIQIKHSVWNIQIFTSSSVRFETIYMEFLDYFFS